MEGYYPSTEAAVVVEVSVSPACMWIGRELYFDTVRMKGIARFIVGIVRPDILVSRSSIIGGVGWWADPSHPQLSAHYKQSCIIVWGFFPGAGWSLPPLILIHPASLVDKLFHHRPHHCFFNDFFPFCI
jgi:hypothetical protein